MPWRPTGAFELQNAAALAEAEKRWGGHWTHPICRICSIKTSNMLVGGSGERCLSCANCTMVCPTCFCNDMQEVTDLRGMNIERVRVWDSCFSMFSYVHGGNIRPHTRSRYRQWMTHKLASWVDQFGKRGCIGCGRCITWCPVGIDVTAAIEPFERRGDMLNTITAPIATASNPTHVDYPPELRTSRKKLTPSPLTRRVRG